MTERAAPARSRLRRPTPGQWIGLIVAEGLVWLVAVVADGYADWQPLPWVIAAGMVLVFVAWLSRVRSSPDSKRGRRGDGGYPPTATSDDGTSGSAPD